jgi:hypothetical protein
MNLISKCTNCSPNQKISSAIFIIIIIFWFFNIREQGVLSVSIPREHFSSKLNFFNY